MTQKFRPATSGPITPFGGAGGNTALLDTAPAWHDFPTARGLWVCDPRDGTVPFVLAELDAPNAAKWMEPGAKWYGPIMQETSK